MLWPASFRAFTEAPYRNCIPGDQISRTSTMWAFPNRANVTMPVSVMPISHESPVLSPADMYVRSLLYRMLES